MTPQEKDELRHLIISAVTEAVAPLERKIDALTKKRRDGLVPCREVAERFGVSTRTVKRRVKAKEMWAIDKGGRGLYFDPEEVERAARDRVLP